MSRGRIKVGRRASSGRWFREVLCFLRLTGCRPGEAQSLRWEHVRWDLGVAVLGEHKTVKKTRRPKVLVLPPAALKVLKLIQARDGGRGHVFMTSEGRPWARGGFGQAFRRLRDEIPLPREAVPYGLRHAFGTNAVLAGVDPITVSKLLGHTTARMTERYVHVAGEYSHLAAAARKAARRSKT